MDGVISICNNNIYHSVYNFDDHWYLGSFETCFFDNTTIAIFFKYTEFGERV